MHTPKYTRIAKQVREAKALPANDEGMEQLLRQHLEAIHEEENILQIEEVLQRWD